MAPHYMEDKIWHGIMIAREMTNRGRGEDIILMYDGTSPLRCIIYVTFFIPVSLARCPFGSLLSLELWPLHLKTL